MSIPPNLSSVCVHFEAFFFIVVVVVLGLLSNLLCIYQLRRLFVRRPYRLSIRNALSSGKVRYQQRTKVELHTTIVQSIIFPVVFCCCCCRSEEKNLPFRLKNIAYITQYDNQISINGKNSRQRQILSLLAVYYTVFFTILVFVHFKVFIDFIACLSFSTISLACCRPRRRCRR